MKCITKTGRRLEKFDLSHEEAVPRAHTAQGRRNITSAYEFGLSGDTIRISRFPSVCNIPYRQTNLAGWWPTQRSDTRLDVARKANGREFTRQSGYGELGENASMVGHTHPRASGKPDCHWLRSALASPEGCSLAIALAVRPFVTNFLKAGLVFLALALYRLSMVVDSNAMWRRPVTSRWTR